MYLVNVSEQYVEYMMKTVLQTIHYTVNKHMCGRFIYHPLSTKMAIYYIFLICLFICQILILGLSFSLLIFYFFYSLENQICRNPLNVIITCLNRRSYLHNPDNFVIYVLYRDLIYMRVSSVHSLVLAFVFHDCPHRK